MLILTRRMGEVLKIGDEIEVVVLGVKGNQVRFGIEAPKNVSVHRKEIYDKIQEEKKQEVQKELKNRSTEIAAVAITEAVPG